MRPSLLKQSNNWLNLALNNPQMMLTGEMSSP